MELKVNIDDYLSKEEIKEACVEQLKSEIHKFFTDEQNAQRLLSNLSYQIIFDEVDKFVPNCQQVIIDKTKELIEKKDFNFMVFNDSVYSSKSLAIKYVEQAVNDNKALLNAKVKDTIENHDYSRNIWDKFEELADSFISNIYEIVKLGRNDGK